MTAKAGIYYYLSVPAGLITAAGEAIIYNVDPDAKFADCCYLELRLCSTLGIPSGGPFAIPLTDVPDPFTQYNYFFKMDDGQCVTAAIVAPFCDTTGYTIYSGTHTPIERCAPGETCTEGTPDDYCFEARLCADDSLVGYVRQDEVYQGLIYKTDPLADAAESCVYLVVIYTGCPEDDADYLNTVEWEAFADCEECGVEPEACPPCEDIEDDLPSSVSAGSVALGDTCTSNTGTLFKGVGCTYSGAITWNCSSGRVASGTITLVRQPDGSWTLTISHSASTTVPPFGAAIPSTGATYSHFDEDCSPNGEYEIVVDDGIGGWPSPLMGFIS